MITYISASSEPQDFALIFPKLSPLVIVTFQCAVLIIRGRETDGRTSVITGLFPGAGGLFVRDMWVYLL